MQYLLSREEFHKLGPKSEIEKWKNNALKLSKRLARRVSRAEKGPSIGGFGCILEPNCESKYCYGCPAEDLCPYEYKSWPK